MFDSTRSADMLFAHITAGGDAFISICLWQAGYAMTDPGLGLFHPDLQVGAEAGAGRAQQSGGGAVLGGILSVRWDDTTRLPGSAPAASGLQHHMSSARVQEGRACTHPQQHTSKSTAQHSQPIQWSSQHSPTRLFSSLQYFDPGPEDRVGAMLKLSQYIDNTATKQCDALCEVGGGRLVMRRLLPCCCGGWGGCGGGRVWRRQQLQPHEWQVHLELCG